MGVQRNPVQLNVCDCLVLPMLHKAQMRATPKELTGATLRSLLDLRKAGAALPTSGNIHRAVDGSDALTG